MSKNKKESVIAETLKIYWRATKKYKFHALAVAILIPLGIILNAYVSPLIVAQVINKLQAGVPQDQLWQVFSPLIFAGAGIYIFSELFVWRAGIWILWKMQMRIYHDLYEEAFEKMVNQSMSFHAQKMSGSMVSAARNFANSYIGFLDTAIFNILRILIGVIAIVVILTPIAPLYTLGLFALAIIFAIISASGLDKVATAQKKSTKEHNRLSGIFTDAISNILSTKANSRESQELKNIKDQGAKAFSAEMNFAKKVTLRDLGFGSVLATGNLLILLVAVFGQFWFGISLGTLILMMDYSQRLLSQLWDINRIIRGISKAFGDADEMTRLISTENPIKDIKGAKPLKVKGGKIEFKDVDFRHDDKPTSLFTDFNLKIKAGEKIGLVGSSGSGKSTLTKMILRFSDVESGEVLIDEQNISKVTQSSLRNSISYVPQESSLFDRTIRENIAYGRPDASEKEIIKAAKLANAWDFIKDLPDGLETTVGERGTKLSGGQKQRISIARAILKNSPILILDEATSALDTESEKLIQDALENLMKNRTSIVIAHRLSTIQQMDRIIVIEDGEIVEQGSHKELLKLDAQYAKLWKIQSGEA
ncbi:MAG: ABC transporter ATP-binding protein [bacterium]|nr:ABC transporter ATP-binding protein [bacterium]